MEQKRVLLIAGGGTLGTYVGQELLSKGHTVEVICPEEKHSDNERLIFHQSRATEELLRRLFSQKHYDGIVNFIHYKKVEDYMAIYPLLIQNTDHLIFLSSYRTYANEQHPVTEEAPRLLDVIKDPEFQENEDYALPKSRCEDFLHTQCAGQPWTVVRPVISFSERRLDLFMYSRTEVLEAVQRGEALMLPSYAKDYTAGLDWAGNSGKLITNLLFKPETIGQCYTVYSGHGLTWGQVAEAYNRTIGLAIDWVDEETFLKSCRVCDTPQRKWMYFHDRRYDRDMDASKILQATGLTKEDFGTVEEGICAELKKLGYPIQ